MAPGWVDRGNNPPTAVATAVPQSVHPVETVNLSGLDSYDDNTPTESLEYYWELTVKPDGSTATPFFTPDLPGQYTTQLIVNDGFEDSEPAEVVVSVITAQDHAENRINEALNIVRNLPPASVTTKGNQTALCNFLIQAIAALQAGDIDETINKLNKSLNRTDGCILRDGPDENGPGRDWVIDCDAQEQIYQMLNDALDVISP